jgi:transposase
MRVAAAIHLGSETQAELQSLVRRQTTPMCVVERCRIVLLEPDGLQDKQIAKRLSVAPLMASRWRSRFRALGVAGLVKDAPQPGRTPTITTKKVSEVIAVTTQSKPVNSTQ